MKAFRIYSGADNKCHFEDVQITYSPEGRMGEDARLPASAEPPQMRRFTEFFRHYHVARWKRTFIMLEGEMDVVSTTGEYRRMLPGDICHMEDIKSEGHIFREVNDKQIIGVIYTWADQSIVLDAKGEPKKS